MDDAAFFGLPAAGGDSAVEVREVSERKGSLFTGEEGAGSEQGKEEGFHEGKGFMGGSGLDLKSVIVAQGRTLISFSQRRDSACHLSQDGPL